IGFSLKPLFCYQKVGSKALYNPSFSIYFFNFQLVNLVRQAAIKQQFGPTSSSYFSAEHRCRQAQQNKPDLGTYKKPPVFPHVLILGVTLLLSYKDDETDHPRAYGWNAPSLCQ
ncbi:MAG: hypothetical protein WBO58_12160, partial [Gammaproteobacteria bacterium]